MPRAIVLLLRLLTAGRVWDIRIEREEGDSDFSSALILEELEEAGLAVGDRWSRIDRDGVETALLSSSSHIGWVSITRTGAVAHVKVREKTKFRGEPVAEEDGYANIVAAFDCVIEEITVVRGFAVVSVGDTVRAGDLLISGILPEEAGGGFCRAEGSADNSGGVGACRENGARDAGLTLKLVDAMKQLFCLCHN